MSEGSIFFISMSLWKMVTIERKKEVSLILLIF